MSQPAYIEPLSRRARLAVLATVVFFHVGVGWALTQVQPPKLEISEMSSMEVRMVAPDAPPVPDAPTEPVTLDAPPPEDTPPPEVPLLEAAVAPPQPDLPPPEFPVVVKPPPPKPAPPKPQPKPQPQQAAPAPAPAPAAVAPDTPQIIQMFQVAYNSPPNPVYPLRSRRAGEQGTVQIRAYIDASGTPTQVVVEKSSGHPALDEAAVSAMRAARVRSNGRPMWVVGPITFNLQ